MGKKRKQNSAFFILLNAFRRFKEVANMESKLLISNRMRLIEKKIDFGVF